MPRARSALLSVVVALIAAAVAPVAHARVMLVATGRPVATLLDVQSGALVARLPVGGATRAVAVAPDGVRGYVTAGAGIAAIDLNGRAKVGAVPLRRSPTALAMSGGGTRLVAARRGALDLIDPAALTVTRSVGLGARARRPGALAVSADSAKAVVAIDDRRIAIVDLLGGGVRRLRLAGVTGLAFAPTGRHAYALAVTRRRTALVTIDTAAGRLGRAIRTGRGPGGGVAVAANGRYVAAGAGTGSRVTAIFDLPRGRVAARLAGGTGPGHPAVAPDGVRLYTADQRAGTISVFSALSFRRLSVRRLPSGARPSALAVQAGMGLMTGTDGPDRLTGTRLGDRIDALAGDDTLLGGRGGDLLHGGEG